MAPSMSFSSALRHLPSFSVAPEKRFAASYSRFAALLLRLALLLLKQEEP